ncbi:MAG: crotonase/enoyl-CoA hydratase family protein [Actinomycetota bacterium]|nr:crotonase/enoyl-CoA hydratase family protein [Actinomycetota bacterium]MDA8396356.1 crotonase/enoyl-CoA hydratase family protein [Actinomycetota bacterium]
MPETILYERHGHAAVITLNRPDRMNGFTRVMGAELIQAMDKADADDGVRAVVFTGAGRAFCAGADLGGGGKTFDYTAAEPGEDDHRDGGGLVSLRIFDSKKPTIAAFNGPAVGVGVTMTLPMDFRIAARGAKFGFVFTRRGVVPEAASSWFLPKAVGMPAALDWVLTGRVFGADEALERGLVSKVVEPEELMPTALALVGEIAENTAPVSVAMARAMLWNMAGANHPLDAHRLDSRAMWLRGSSADAYEGVQSFLEKRSPEFRDRLDEMPELFED